MGTKIKRFSQSTGGDMNQDSGDWTQEQRETTVDGQTFHWAPGQVRNFLDQGVGAAHGAQLGSPSIVREDSISTGDSRF